MQPPNPDQFTDLTVPLGTGSTEGVWQKPLLC